MASNKDFFEKNLDPTYRGPNPLSSEQRAAKKQCVPQVLRKFLCRGVNDGQRFAIRLGDAEKRTVFRHDFVVVSLSALADLQHV